MKRLVSGSRVVLGAVFRGFLCLVCLAAFRGMAWGAASAPAAAAAPAPAQDPMEVMTAVRAEAERGDAGAMFTMGGIFVEGVIVPRNFSIAREWYEKAAKAGLAEGIFNVGVCWETGMGSAADITKAVEFYKRAADMNLPQALFKMSVLHDSGVGVTQDQAAAIDYLRRAAEAKYPDAAAIWGLICLNGSIGEPRDGAKGLSMLNVAAEAGNVEAMKNIAVVYKDGIEVKASAFDAMKWYLIAEKCGYPKGGDLEEVKGELRKKLKKDQHKNAETEADAWINAVIAKRNG
jgi:TPR repeat protein